MLNKGEDKLKKAHPILKKIIKDGCENVNFPVNIAEVERSIERQRELYEKGKSKTMNSKHLIQKDGYSHAVDAYPLTEDCKLIDNTKYRELTNSFKSVSEKLGVKISCGIDWKPINKIGIGWDAPHTEIVI